MQTANIVISDNQTGEIIDKANIDGNVTDSSQTVVEKFTGITDNIGEFSYSWEISNSTRPGQYAVNVESDPNVLRVIFITLRTEKSRLWDY